MLRYSAGAVRRAINLTSIHHGCQMLEGKSPHGITPYRWFSISLPPRRYGAPAPRHAVCVPRSSWCSRSQTGVDGRRTAPSHARCPPAASAMGRCCQRRRRAGSGSECRRRVGIPGVGADRGSYVGSFLDVALEAPGTLELHLPFARMLTFLPPCLLNHPFAVWTLMTPQRHLFR